MSRIKLEIPEIKVFETDLTIRISDINYGNHLGNDSVLSLMHEARYSFYKSLGYPNELNIDGIGTIQVDTAIQYKGEGFHGDQVLIEIFLGDTTPKSMDLYYKLTSEGRILALGKTGIAFYNYSEKKVSNMPVSIQKQLEAFQSAH